MNVDTQPVFEVTCVYPSGHTAWWFWLIVVLLVATVLWGVLELRRANRPRVRRRPEPACVEETHDEPYEAGG